MNEYVGILREFGFPIFVALLLLWDKMRSNGKLGKVVENNNMLLCEIREELKNGRRK